MSEFFYANKQSREKAFHFPNGVGNQDPPEENGDQAARLHPAPAVLGNGQKVSGDVTGAAGYDTPDLRSAGRQPGSAGSPPPGTNNR